METLSNLVHFQGQEASIMEGCLSSETIAHGNFQTFHLQEILLAHADGSGAVIQATHPAQATGAQTKGGQRWCPPTPGCPAEHATLATTVSRNLPSHKSQRPLLKPSLASAGMTKVWGEGAMCVCKYGGWRVASPSYVHCCNAICSSSRI